MAGRTACRGCFARFGAAFALAWKKVQALPGIESFLYHRHVDHPKEYCLLFGIREHDGSANVHGVGRARKLWDVVQKAGTPEEEFAAIQKAEEALH